MTQEEIDRRSTRETDLQLRRHLIAMLRLVETRIGMPSSLRDVIGKSREEKEPK